jgi:AraC family transcriptional regulator
MFDQTRLRIRQYGAGESMAPHEHDEASLNIVFRGDFLERSGRSERSYGRGHVTYCPAGFTHSQTFGSYGASQIIVEPPIDWIDYLADSNVALDAGPHTCAATFGQLGDRLAMEVGNRDAFSSLACEGMLLEIVATFGRICSDKPVNGKPPTWLCKARDFIHDNALQPLRLQEISNAAGRHEIHLAREFRRHFGSSIGAYVRGLRTEHAAKLLLNSRLSVSDIALECGFANHAHLCREFKSRLGVTPTRYREGTNP